ncbi:hypothetical protein DICPUDRAFT_91073 [Dictyostelium purpureum]|uniref:Cytochrome b561 domain-containing protein n=1 Tax=Dictyostelium purpureum TaxID=5786 RepID=F0Z799_DICPU|nr:uncharacterized protein DICPUDRAFT_91073 [Dictyostelium purpureum]EGC40224.1 hypothetical protein DICPUDRAFT_91073 [Dictyostelium purpureum]|eukprot:XP_003283293.1 hypothetical protein DICPUDRAFT_91073 [Dictyostelium purpureum]
MKIILLFLILLINQSICMNEIVVDETVNFRIQWEIENNDSILFILSANIKTWLGIGWSNSNGMNDADYIIGAFNNDGSLNITDRVLPDGAKYQSPFIDSKVGGSNDILTSYGYQTPNYTYVKFTRKLVTDDIIGDRDLTINNPTYLIWARGVPVQSNLRYHHENRGELTLTLGKVNGGTIGTSKKDYISWHIGLMLAAFLVLMPFGILVARYFKQYHYWFPIHYILLGTAFCFVAVGFVIAFMMSQRKFSKGVLHAWFGLFTVIFMVFSVTLGIVSHYMWDETRKKVPIFPDIVHHWISRLTFLLGLVSIWTGFHTYGASKVYSIILGFVVTLFVSLVVFLEIYKKKYPKESLLGNNKFKLKNVINEGIETEGANN